MAKRASGYIDQANWTCPECGSARVQEQVWREVNDPSSVMGEAGSDYWCDGCYEDEGDGVISWLVQPGVTEDE